MNTNCSNTSCSIEFTNWTKSNIYFAVSWVIEQIKQNWMQSDSSRFDFFCNPFPFAIHSIFFLYTGVIIISLYWMELIIKEHPSIKLTFNLTMHEYMHKRTKWQLNTKNYSSSDSTISRNFTNHMAIMGCYIKLLTKNLEG